MVGDKAVTAHVKPTPTVVGRGHKQAKGIPPMKMCQLQKAGPGFMNRMPCALPAKTIISSGFFGPSEAKI
jgi:hypothetical protein